MLQKALLSQLIDMIQRIVDINKKSIFVRYQPAAFALPASEKKDFVILQQRSKTGGINNKRLRRKQERKGSCGKTIVDVYVYLARV